MNLKIRVKNLVKKHGTANPSYIARNLGIRIFTAPLPDTVRGFLVRVLRRKFIFINENLSDFSQQVVLCHELGHARLHTGYGYYFHPDTTYYVASTHEREANEFAAHLLSYNHDIDGIALAAIIQEKRPDPKTVHKILSEFILS